MTSSIDLNVVISALALAVTALAIRPAYLAIKNTAWIEVRNKRIDVLIHCIHRYESLTYSRKSFSNEGPLNSDEKVYFRRLWAIKQEQIDFWIDGFVAPESLIDWFMADVDYFSNRKESSISESKYRDGWNFVKENHNFISDDFKYIIDFIAENICSAEARFNEDRQKALLFCHFQELESRQAAKFRRRHADGVGRLWFRDLLEEMPSHQQKFVAEECARVAWERSLLPGSEFDPTIEQTGAGASVIRSEKGLQIVTVETRFYSWEDLHGLCDALAQDIVASRRKVDTIVAIARGGLLPALILSFALKIRDVRSISIVTTTDDAPGAPRVPPIVRSALVAEEICGRHCLLVDDVIDTGATMAAARKTLEELGAAEVIGAAMIWSKLVWLENGAKGQCAADFWGTELDHWASVPWEPLD